MKNVQHTNYRRLTALAPFLPPEPSRGTQTIVLRLPGQGELQVDVTGWDGNVAILRLSQYGRGLYRYRLATRMEVLMDIVKQTAVVPDLQAEFSEWMDALEA